MNKIKAIAYTKALIKMIVGSISVLSFLIFTPYYSVYLCDYIDILSNS